MALGIAVLVAGVYLGRGRVLRHIIQMELAKVGIPGARFEVSHFGIDTAVLENIVAVNQAVTARKVIATYSWAGLRSHQIDSITVDGLTFLLTFADNKPQVGALTLNQWRRRLALSGSGGPLPMAALQINHGSVEIDLPEISLRGSIDLSLVPDGRASNGQGHAVHGSLRLSGQGVQIRGHADGQWNVEDWIESSGKGSLAFNLENQNVPWLAKSFSAHGELELEKQRGMLSISAPSLVTAHADELASELIARVPKSVLAYIAGGISADVGSFRWSHRLGHKESSLIANGARFQGAAFDIEGVSTSLKLGDGGLTPHESDSLLAAAAKVGDVSLSHFIARIDVPSSGSYVLTEAQAEIGGGDVEISGLSLPAAERFAVVVRKLDVAELLAMMKIDGLHASGRVSGNIPFERDSHALRITGGTITSDAPGIVRYRPQSPPAALATSPGGAMALKALSNFQYESFVTSLDGPLDGNMEITLSIKGRNPQLYSGYPVALNVNVNGRLADILQQGLSTASVPAAVVKQLGVSQPPRAK